ncbi:MAG: L-threonylcarbamoyladenylate synthase, partial [Pseudonocardiales bacterium]|nr:L-threonylcarbamoyladenylate synthase [Pseudonocardiales bacterium]
RPAALTVAEAQEQLGDEVAVYLDGGPSASGVASTIVDVTAEIPLILRAGAVSAQALREVVPDIAG